MHTRAAAPHHHATKVKAACLDSGDVRLGLSRRSPSERANCCATCRQRMDSTPTRARSDARAATGAREATGGFLVPRLSFKVGFSRGESQNFLSFSFWKENDRIKSGLRPSSETDRQGVLERLPRGARFRRHRLVLLCFPCATRHQCPVPLLTTKHEVRRSLSLRRFFP